MVDRGWVETVELDQLHRLPARLEYTIDVVRSAFDADLNTSDIDLVYLFTSHDCDSHLVAYQGSNKPRWSSQLACMYAATKPEQKPKM